MELQEIKKEEKRKESKEEIINRKLRFSENPSSIVLAPKTKEGHVLTKILFGFDRAVGRIRLSTGTYISVQDAVGALKKGSEIVASFKEVTSLLGDGGGFYGAFFEDLETKRMLARKPTTYILIPKSNEAKEIALLIKRFDPLLLQFKNTCTDFSKSEELFGKISDLIKRFDSLARELSLLAKTPYESPKHIELFGSPALGSVTEDVSARRGKRVGGLG